MSLAPGTHAVEPVVPTPGKLERELREVDEAIAALLASDGFVEELVAYHARRKALIAALADRRENIARKIVRFGSRRKADAIGEKDYDAISKSSR
jgi:hypothetical protein